MTSPLFYLTEGLRMIKNSIKLNAHGFTVYDGDAKEICMHIVHFCWNGRFFQTSTTNFPQFWTRDFGWCVDSLIKLKQHKRIKKTLTYALDTFSKHGAVRTTISPSGKPFDFPTYSVDSLPWLLYSLYKFDDNKLIKKHKEFLEKEVAYFYKTVIDKKTGLVKSSHFSSMKDFAKRKSSCYDNSMVGILKMVLTKLRFENPLKKYNYEKLLVKHFWSGSYFYDDLTKKNYVAADANIFPYFFDIIKSKKMLASSLSQIQKSDLDDPLPVKYTQKKAPVNFIWSEIFMRGYERDAVWTHMGPLYIKLMQKVDLKCAKKYKLKYQKMIESYKNYPEVLNSSGKPFRALFYHCDEGMLWAANFLTL